MRRWIIGTILATSVLALMAGSGERAEALQASIPHMQNPNMQFTGPVEGTLYTRTDVLPQARPWFPSLGPSYGPYADPWFPPKGQVIVTPAARPVTK